MENNISLSNLDENFAAVHAYLCADGYVCRNKPESKYRYYHIGLRNTCYMLLEDFQSRFEKVFNKRPIISRALDRCKIGDKNILFWLNGNFGSFYSADWILPACFLSKNLLAVWLRAFFDCEGWVELKAHKSRVIGLESINAKELEKIRFYLKKYFLIDSSLFPRKGRNTVRLAICGKGDLMNFKKFIGFLHPEKKKKLDEAIASFADYVWRFPEAEAELKRFVLQILKRKIKRINPRIIVCSNRKENLLNLSAALSQLFSIASKVSNERFNGFGTKYFELAIQKKESIKRLGNILHMPQ